eukprot:4886338-Pyramimonas_sp.AAC.1
MRSRVTITCSLRPEHDMIISWSLGQTGTAGHHMDGQFIGATRHGNVWAIISSMRSGRGPRWG